MPLHNKNAIRQGMADEVFSYHLLSQPLPKYRFPRHEAPAAAAYQLVHDELLLDGNSRQNLATFCQTWMEPEVHQLMDDCLDKNMIDKDEYPQTAEIEARAVHMIADLWNSPDAADTVGCSTTGSSEAAMLGGLAMKWKWRKKRQAAGKPTDKPNLVCGPVQVCWHKFARYFDVELREIPCQGERLLMSPDEVVRRCDENTIGVVPTLGVTFTLQYEPVREVAAALDRLQETSGLDIPVHVDGASGGFVAPFVQPELEWDFRLPRVKSINASGHKFGLAPLGCGWVIWREASDLPEDLVFRVDYLGGDMPTFALNFSRPGGQIIAQYYNFIRLGRDGYARIQQSCMATGAWFSDRIAGLGPFEIIYDGRGGLPGCSWKIKDGIDPGYNLYDLSDRLRIRGWQVAAYPLPANRRETVIQRVIARHGFSRDLAGLLLADMKGAIEHFKHRPAVKPLTHKEGAGFRH